MGMQNNECRHMDKCCALVAILHSIALQEAAIARILNAEGEKIQKAVCMSNCIDELISVNDSVTDTIKEACCLEESLKTKALAVLEELEHCR